MKVTSISRKLLSKVLSFYFVLTFIVTGVQIIAEYNAAKTQINEDLRTLEKTFSGSLTRAVWELNTQQAKDIAEGLYNIPMIKGILVTDENEQTIIGLGEVGQSDSYNANLAIEDTSEVSFKHINSVTDELFGYQFDLIFQFSGRTTKVGSVTLLSSNQVVFNRIEVGLYFLIGNAMVKTAALVLLFSLAFQKLLTTPLNELTEQINQLDLDDPEASKLHSVTYDKNELNVLEDAYNNLIDELVLFKDKLALTQQDLVMANQRLDEQNLILEQEVAKKTSSLSTTMLKMEMQQRELLQQQSQLKDENNRRRKTELILTNTNKDLQSSIQELHKAQERLLDAEKMAVLGGLSAEVSHEVNTPIGVGITSTTYLADLITKLEHEFNSQKLTKRTFEEFIGNANQSVNLLINNLSRASDLISSFKQVAVDQTSDKIRLVNIGHYIDEVIHSLHPKLKKTSHSIKVNCADNIEVQVHAGALSQIFTNLIINSIIHGFENINRGEIRIDVSYNRDRLHITYQDNGNGLTKDQKERLFDPFYTTKSGAGGSGLGTHIIYSLVTDSLNGTIDVESEPNQGLTYHIEFANMK